MMQVTASDVHAATMSAPDPPRRARGVFGTPRVDALRGFEAALEAYGPEIYRFLRRQSPTAEDAADLHQETFLRAYKAYGRIDEGANVRAWLYRIAANLATDAFRARRPTLQLDDGGPGVAAAGPERQALAAELRAAVRSALVDLSGRQRTAVVLHVFEGRDYDEVARALDCSEVTARKHVSLGLAKLRVALEGWR